MRRRLRSDEKSGLLQAGVLSFLFHIAIIIILGLSARLAITKVVPTVYRVAIMPFSPPGSGDGTPRGGGLPVSSAAAKSNVKAVPKAEKNKERPAKEEISLVPKKQKTPAAKKDEQHAAEEAADRSIQEAIEEIHRKVAIEEIQKRVAERGGGTAQSGRGSAQGPIVATGSGIGSGTGTGSGGGTAEQVHAGMVEKKIKQEWALPENFPRGKSELETIIIVIIERDGTVQRSWFEKTSGNVSYDQMAMRAIKKAEPLPPFLKGMTESTVAIGIRFGPD
jgi:TolA protein